MKHELSQKDKQSVMPVILIALKNMYIQTCAQGWDQSRLFYYYTGDNKRILPFAYACCSPCSQPPHKSCKLILYPILYCILVL